MQVDKYEENQIAAIHMTLQSLVLSHLFYIKGDAMFHGDLAAVLNLKSWFFKNHNMFTPCPVLFSYLG